MTAAPIRLTSYPDAMAALKHPQLVQALYDAGSSVMGDALITLHGDAHAQRRVVEFSVFRRSFFREYQRSGFPSLLSKVLQPYLAQGEADLVELGYRVTMNLTADLAGVDRPRGDVNETEKLLALVKTFSTGATLAHSTLDHSEVNARVRDALEGFSKDFLNNSIERRRGLLEKGQPLPNDVLSKLLSAESKLPLSPAVLRREIAFYLQAGAHSTANAMVQALDELFAWFASGHCSAVELCRQPALLQRAVHESLRLHPASPVARRRAIAPLEIGGQRLKVDDLVEVDLVQANRDPHVFGSDAALFNPRRETKQGAWPFGLSFGYGNHACMGRDLDGGIVPKPGVEPEQASLGIVPLLVQTLLRHGATRNGERAPMADTTTSRPNFASYPVRFTGEEAA